MEDLTDQMRTKDDLLNWANQRTGDGLWVRFLEVLVDIRDQLVVLADKARSEEAKWKDVVDTFAPILQMLPDAVAEKKREGDSDDLEDIPEIKLESSEGYTHCTTEADRGFYEPVKFFCVHGDDAHTCTKCYPHAKFCEHGTDLNQHRCFLCDNPPRPEQPGKKDFVLPRKD